MIFLIWEFKVSEIYTILHHSVQKDHEALVLIYEEVHLENEAPLHTHLWYCMSLSLRILNIYSPSSVTYWCKREVSTDGCRGWYFWIDSMCLRVRWRGWGEWYNLSLWSQNVDWKHGVLYETHAYIFPTFHIWPTRFWSMDISLEDIVLTMQNSTITFHPQNQVLINL